MVDVTAAGLTAVEARMERTSRWSDRTMTRGNMWYSTGAARTVRERERAIAKRVRMGVGNNILVACLRSPSSLTRDMKLPNSDAKRIQGESKDEEGCQSLLRRRSQTQLEKEGEVSET